MAMCLNFKYSIKVKNKPWHFFMVDTTQIVTICKANMVPHEEHRPGTRGRSVKQHWPQPFAIAALIRLRHVATVPNRNEVTAMSPPMILKQWGEL